MAKARTELESLLSAKDEAIKLEQQKLQQEKQRVHNAVKQLIALNAMSYQAIADLFKLSIEEVELIAQDIQQTTH